MKNRRSLVVVSIALLNLAAFSAPAMAAETYDVTTSPGKSTPGQKGTASVTIAGKAGWHINDQAPVVLKLTTAETITVDKPRMSRADLAENKPDRARFDVNFVAKTAGAQTIAAEASFVMCQEAACKPVKEKLTLALDVADPKAAAPAAPAKDSKAKPSKGKSKAKTS